MISKIIGAEVIETSLNVVNIIAYMSLAGVSVTIRRFTELNFIFS